MRNEIIEHLVNITDRNIAFKSQQMDEDDLTDNEKRQIISDLLNSRKYFEFFNRFGAYLTDCHLKYFDEIPDSDSDSYLIKIMVNDLLKSRTNVSRKNRRFTALNKLLNNSSYFSEYEMMKRAPDLYEQLIGQYLDPNEIEERNKTVLENVTVFDLLTNENEMKMLKNLKKPTPKQKSGPKHWGEMSSENEPTKISDEEKVQFRKEFRTQMIERFLSGHDPDFDYNNVDFNQEYDNEIQNRDFEDSYFDSEESSTSAIKQ